MTSFDLVDTHHAKSTVCQIKYKLLQMRERNSEPIGTIAEIKAAKIPILPNGEKYGIPQGTPISSALSNAYMIDVDAAMGGLCRSLGALYQRYSDDILIACQICDEDCIVKALKATIESHKLEIKDTKTERVVFNAARPRQFQYLGFNISPHGACIRSGSLSRQWRKLRRSIRTTKRIGQAAISMGSATKIYTKGLRKKLSPIGVRNFSAYARRSAHALGSKGILRQIHRLERAADQAIRELET